MTPHPWRAAHTQEQCAPSLTDSPARSKRPDALLDIDAPRPVAAGRDILVEMHALSVNPVDTKVRGAFPPSGGRSERILGWDAAGVVVAVGRGHVKLVSTLA